MLRASAAALGIIAALVPSHRRDEWRREWIGELWYDLARHENARSIGAGIALATVWRVAGAAPHALWLRRNEWRLEMIIQDLAYALRNTVRRPAFAALVVATLGLGIGVNTAMFTVVNSVLIQPLPYRQPDQLVFMYGSFRNFDRAAISPPDFLDYRAANTVFSSFAAQQLVGQAVITGGGEPERVTSTAVTANYFATLGVSPIRGRTFLASEEEGEGHDAVILSYGLWQRRFGGDPAILGRSVTVDGEVRKVVGVMPPILDRTLFVQIWRPLVFHTEETSTRRFHFLRAIGRLAPGVTIARAQAAMDVTARQLEATYPENATWHLAMLPYRDVIVGNVGTTLLTLLAAVGLVLLIACGNVASLLLARASSRQGEIAIRTALGASRTRLLRQLLTESMVLATGGGLVGLLLAAALVRALRGMGEGILPRLAEVSIDSTVLLFTVGLSLFTGVVFGLAPAFHSVRNDLAASFASLARNSGTRRTVRARDALVVAQVALSLVLLVGAGLLVRSLWKLQHVDPGFNPTGVLTAELTLSRERYPNREAQNRFWRELTDKLRAIPGARVASLTTMLPMRGGGDTYYFVDGQPPAKESDRRNAMVNVVGDDYFETMRIPIVTGRAFTAQDRVGPNTILISGTMARRLFPNESAVGRRLVVDFGKPFTAEIIGVAGDVRAFGLAADAPDVFYFSIHQGGGFGRGYMNILVRSDHDPQPMAGALRAAVTSLDRDIPLANLGTMSDVVSQSTSREQFTTRLLAGFAASALLLAVVGLYGVLAYVVAQRTRELGIRIALGASGSEVVRLVVRRGMTIVGLGVSVGLATAFMATKLVERLLFGVQRTDPLVFATVTITLILASLAACLLPARQATRVDPLVALRAEA